MVQKGQKLSGEAARKTKEQNEVAFEGQAECNGQTAEDTVESVGCPLPDQSVPSLASQYLKKK